jgi:murein DD-endopeptidase MepM/ murein hydrolase activator NlpD
MLLGLVVVIAPGTPSPGSASALVACGPPSREGVPGVDLDANQWQTASVIAYVVPLDVPDRRHLPLARKAQGVEASAPAAASRKWEALRARVVRRLTGGDPACTTHAWVRPLGTAHYVLTAGFGECGTHWAGCHTGQDFAVPTGSRVFTVGAGVVTFAGWDGPYGNAVHVLHAGGTATWYAHLSQIRADGGSRVRAGTLLGLSGASGNTTGPHLHFEVRLAASASNPGTPIDPLPWLRQRHAL